MRNYINKLTTPRHMCLETDCIMINGLPVGPQ